MAQSWKLLASKTWSAVRALFAAIKHFERREYGAALESFETVLSQVRNPDPDYLAFRAYLLLLNGSHDTVGAWGEVVASARGEAVGSSRYAAAVAQYYIAYFEGSSDTFRRWRDAISQRPKRGVAAYIQLPELAVVE